MANRKGTSVKGNTRPTLDEVKAQSGRNLFVSYEGDEGGGWSIPALRPRFVGDVPEELMITPWEPKIIGTDWLDDTRFAKLYNDVKGIRVWKSDIFPEKPNLKLPEELERRVSPARQQMAYTIAVSPYDFKMKDMIQIKNLDVTESEAIEWEKNDLFPFLKAVQFYETRLLKRKVVLKDVEARLRDILGKKMPMDQIESY